MDAPIDENTLPGCEIIGSGYDVINGYYADAKSCLINLFDFPAEYETVKVGSRVLTKPKEIDYHSIPGTTSYTVYGNTITEYQSSLNSRIQIEGSYTFFSSSIDLEIGETAAKSTNNAFTKIYSRVDHYSLQLPPKASEYLKRYVQEDIDTMTDLTRLFDTYGTHYLAKIVMGGTAIYTSTTRKSSFSSTYDIKFVADLAYKSALGGLSTSEQEEYGESIKSFNESSDSNITNKGGASEYGNANYPQHVDEWAKSVEDYLAFIDFLGNGSLVGLWELASTNERLKEIREFYPTYCEMREKLYFISDGPLLRARIVSLNKVQFTDSGSGARQDLSVCIPDIGGGWYFLGQVALPGGGASGKTLVVQEMYPGSGVLVDVHEWDKVWDDTGSKKKKDYNLWRGLAANPVEYVVLSDFFRGGVNNQYAPTTEEATGIKAVAKVCLAPGKIGDMVWNDVGTKAKKDASVWYVLPANGTAIDMSNLVPYYVSVQSHSKPTREVYVLSKSAVKFE